MLNKDFIPKKDRDFLSWAINFLKYLLSILARITFPNDVYLELVTLRDDFAQKFETAEEPATRTKLTVQAKKTARKTLEKRLRQAVKEYLTFNHAVTDEDRDGLGLPIYKDKRTPAPVATKAPDFDVDTSVIGRVGINFYEKDGDHKRGKPAGQHCVEIAWAILDTPPARWDELIHSAADTHTPYTFVFENDRRGKTLYFALRWENTTGQKGPWSEIQSAIIP
ncbi:MAG: hypothetical protein LBS55_13105 [Prevotellaceae bacterium]|jgi:hypothetical protein|nr:hypothetical protein [Prevotellaceae bacterium]